METGGGISEESHLVIDPAGDRFVDPGDVLFLGIRVQLSDLFNPFRNQAVPEGALELLRWPVRTVGESEPVTDIPDKSKRSMFIPGNLFAPAPPGIEPTGAAPLGVSEEVIGVRKRAKITDLEFHAVSLAGMAQVIGNGNPRVNPFDQSTLGPVDVHSVESIRALKPGVIDKPGSSITMRG